MSDTFEHHHQSDDLSSSLFPGKRNLSKKRSDNNPLLSNLLTCQMGGLASENLFNEKETETHHQQHFDRFHPHHHDTIPSSEENRPRISSSTSAVPSVTAQVQQDLEEDAIDLDVVHPSTSRVMTLNFLGSRRKHGKKLPSHHYQTAARKQASILLYSMDHLFLKKMCKELAL